MTTDNSMSRAPRVFMAEPSRVDVDISTAAQYGEVVTVFQPPPRRGAAGPEDRPRNTYRPSVFEAEAFMTRFTRDVCPMEKPFDLELPRGDDCARFILSLLD